MLSNPNILVILAFLASSVTQDLSQADRDRAQFPASDQPFIFYLTTEPYDGEEAQDLERGIKLMCASASRQPVLENCTPQSVPGTNLMRIDLRGMGWGPEDWRAIFKRYPYRVDPDGTQVVFRADWLLVQLSDSVESDAYYRLMFGRGESPQPVKKKPRPQSDQWQGMDGYGRPAPKPKAKPKEVTLARFKPPGRDSVLEMLGVGSEPSLRFGLIEGKSGVAKQGMRWIENRPVLRGYAWGTRDVIRLDADSDPLEHPGGDFQHDAEEWIFGIPKMSRITGDRGVLQAYLLANGEGNILDRAPVDIVEDSTCFRNFREIRNPGGCIQCHVTGIIMPTQNAFGKLIKSGVEVYTEQEQQQSLEAFHLSNLNREIARNQDDYALIVSLVTGVEPKDAVVSFTKAIRRYDADVGLETAASELDMTPEDLRLAFATSSGIGQARLVALAHNQAMPRTRWEEMFYEAQATARIWKEKNQ